MWRSLRTSADEPRRRLQLQSISAVMDAGIVLSVEEQCESKVHLTADICHSHVWLESRCAFTCKCSCAVPSTNVPSMPENLSLTRQFISDIKIFIIIIIIIEGHIIIKCFCFAFPTDTTQKSSLTHFLTSPLLFCWLINDIRGSVP